MPIFQGLSVYSSFNICNCPFLLSLANLFPRKHIYERDYLTGSAGNALSNMKLIGYIPFKYFTDRERLTKLDLSNKSPKKARPGFKAG